jgi:hypothetical protein
MGQAGTVGKAVGLGGGTLGVLVGLTVTLAKGLVGMAVGAVGTGAGPRDEPWLTGEADAWATIMAANRTAKENATTDMRSKGFCMFALYKFTLLPL